MGVYGSRFRELGTGMLRSNVYRSKKEVIQGIGFRVENSFQGGYMRAYTGVVYRSY